jgi:uncharacterized iron-regulated protein
MVETAKAAHRPVHAANAPRAYATLARKEGYERLRQLTPEQQRMVRIPDRLFGGRYRADFDKVMTPAHGDEAEPAASAEFHEVLDQTFRAQSLWDWTMADSATAALARGEMPVVHVVGRFHVDFRGGLVQAIEALRPDTRTLVVSFVDAWSDALAEDDAERGDFVIYVGPAPDEGE